MERHNESMFKTNGQRCLGTLGCLGAFELSSRAVQHISFPFILHVMLTLVVSGTVWKPLPHWTLLSSASCNLGNAASKSRNKNRTISITGTESWRRTQNRSSLRRREITWLSLLVIRTYLLHSIYDFHPSRRQLFIQTPNNWASNAMPSCTQQQQRLKAAVCSWRSNLLPCAASSSCCGP